ncbi:hypothetical protein LZ31DRAFT_560825 [Colletotrichum somersetense]|nr:hypothetical protein LZ31DRAFT_560825 [Colletotrichum somersetense]
MHMPKSGGPVMIKGPFVHCRSRKTRPTSPPPLIPWIPQGRGANEATRPKASVRACEPALFFSAQKDPGKRGMRLSRRVPPRGPPKKKKKKKEQRVVMCVASIRQPCHEGMGEIDRESWSGWTSNTCMGLWSNDRVWPLTSPPGPGPGVPCRNISHI